MFPFLGQGHLPSENSFFAGVTACPSNSIVTIRPGESPDVRDVDDLFDRMDTVEPTADAVDRVVNALLSVTRPLGSGAIDIGLTGGSDSRLLAVLLRVHGVEFTTFTTGAPTDTDAEVATQLAKVLEVPHQVQPTSRVEEEVVAVSVADRLFHILQSTDLAVFGYGTLCDQPHTFNAGTLGYTGGGGELPRTVYGSRVWRDAESARRRLSGHATGGEFDHLTPAAQLSARLRKLSVLWRTGRWGSGVSMSRFGVRSQRPFYDNDLLRVVLPLTDETVASEVLYYEVLKTLAPNVLRVPFGDRAWSLARSSRTEYRRIGESPPALVMVGGSRRGAAGAARRAWRSQVDGLVGAELLAIVRQGKELACDLMGFVDIDRLDAAVRTAVESGNALPVKRRWATASWAMAAAMIRGRPAAIQAKGLGISH